MNKRRGTPHLHCTSEHSVRASGRSPCSVFFVLRLHMHTAPLLKTTAYFTHGKTGRHVGSFAGCTSTYVDVWCASRGSTCDVSDVHIYSNLMPSVHVQQYRVHIPGYTAVHVVRYQLFTSSSLRNACVLLCTPPFQLEGVAGFQANYCGLQQNLKEHVAHVGVSYIPDTKHDSNVARDT